MSFTEAAKLTALAIVKVFETGKPIGDYSAVAVLKDGAGISYGINQFTHKSGSLEFVLRRYKVLGGALPEGLAIAWPVILNPTRSNISGLSLNPQVKAELRTLGKDPLMQRAQKEIAFEKYMRPSIEACEGSNFNYPLSLAVVYDSKNHGSYDKIRDRVQLELPASIKPEEFEREWITEYCKQRYKWLHSSRGVLKNTVNRPQTFLELIKKDNWNLDLPLDVKLGQGRIRLNPSILTTSAAPPQTSDIPEGTTTGAQLADSATPAADTLKPPVETVVTRTEDGVTVEASKTNQQDVNVPADVAAPEPYLGVGFWGVIKRDFAAATGGNLSLAGLSEYAQQASGWPPWIIGMISKLAIGALIATFGYLIFRVIHYAIDSWKKNQKVKVEVSAATDVNRKDVNWI